MTASNGLEVDPSVGVVSSETSVVNGAVTSVTGSVLWAMIDTAGSEKE